MPIFEISPGADADLDEVFDYTARRWGADQAYKYLLELERCAEALASGQGRIKNLSHIRTGLRSMRCQHHYIYCLMLAESLPLVVAVLHEHMDLMTRIAERLK